MIELLDRLEESLASLISLGCELLEGLGGGEFEIEEVAACVILGEVVEEMQVLL